MKFVLIVTYECDSNTYEQIDVQYNGGEIGKLRLPLSVNLNLNATNTMYTRERRDAVAGLFLTAINAVFDKKMLADREAREVEGTHKP